MRHLKFLLKPGFFVFNLLFATWLVFEIEKISPSDFGRYHSLFEDPKPAPVKLHKLYLKKICSDYKAGKIDSTELEHRLEKYFKLPTEVLVK